MFRTLKILSGPEGDHRQEGANYAQNQVSQSKEKHMAEIPGHLPGKDAPNTMGAQCFGHNILLNKVNYFYQIPGPLSTFS